MDVLEMTVSRGYDNQTGRRIRLLKGIRAVLILGLVLAWIFGISIAAALVSEMSGAATRWMLFFAMFTIPAATLLILVWRAIRKLTKEFDYLLNEEGLEIDTSLGGTRRKPLVRIRRGCMVAFGRQAELPPARGKVILAACGQEDLWALDTCEDGQPVRILMAPNEAFQRRLRSYVLLGVKEL